MSHFRKWGLAGAAMLVASALLAACPTTAVVCSSFLKPCGQTCKDVRTDAKNCGGCGIACSAGQVCLADGGGNGVPGCACQAGSVSCGGQCVVTTSDAKNCGGCGIACSAGQVCQNSKCQAACTVPVQDTCQGACVDVTSDPNNCSACGSKCPASESCHQGACTFDVLFGCAAPPGGVIGLNATTLQLGTYTPLGTSVEGLGVLGPFLLDLDGQAGKLDEASLATLTLYPQAPAVTGPTALFVDGTSVYVSSNAPSVQVLRQTGALDGGGAGLTPVASVDLGADAGITGGGSPASMAKLGTALYVTLQNPQAVYGKVAQVDVSQPASPTLVRAVDLTTGLDLKPFPGATPSPSPWGVAAFQSKVYVALQNRGTLADGGQGAAGDALLAVLDPAGDGGVSKVVDLGSAPCLEPSWLAPSADGTHLFVSCSGQAQVNGSGQTVSVTGAAVLALDDRDQRVAQWTCTGGDGGCTTFSPGAFAVRGSRLYVGDNSLGRAVILDSADGGLSEVVGDATTGPLQVCPTGGTGNTDVSAVLVTP